MTLTNRLVDELIRHRVGAGHTQRSLGAALGVTNASVYTVERHRPANPRVSTLVEYAYPCGQRLVLSFDHPAVLAAAPPELALLAGGFVGAAMVEHLRRHREHARISRKAIHAAHGWKWYSLAALEYGDREPYLSSLQRYARVLGGAINARWEAL